jgi:glucose/mannose transport system permease protein
MADLTTTAPGAVTNPRATLQDWLPKVVLAPSFAVTPAVRLRVHPVHHLPVVHRLEDAARSTSSVGLSNYSRLWAQENWHIAISNIAIFASLYIVICTALGLMLAIFLDQKIRGEGAAAPDLSLSDGSVLHRDGHGLEVVPRSGHRS